MEKESRNEREPWASAELDFPLRVSEGSLKDATLRYSRGIGYVGQEGETISIRITC